MEWIDSQEGFDGANVVLKLGKAIVGRLSVEFEIVQVNLKEVNNQS